MSQTDDPEQCEDDESYPCWICGKKCDPEERDFNECSYDTDRSDDSWCSRVTCPSHTIDDSYCSLECKDADKMLETIRGIHRNHQIQHAFGNMRPSPSDYEIVIKKL